MCPPTYSAGWSAGRCVSREASRAAATSWWTAVTPSGRLDSCRCSTEPCSMKVPWDLNTFALATKECKGWFTVTPPHSFCTWSLIHASWFVGCNSFLYWDYLTRGSWRNCKKQWMILYWSLMGNSLEGGQFFRHQHWKTGGEGGKKRKNAEERGG